MGCIALRKVSFVVLALSVVMTASSAQADQGRTDTANFERLFQRWTDSFNRRDLPGACSLFSPRVVADYRGYPRKDFKSLCNGFKKVFADKDRRYQYRYKLHEVYRSGNLAAVRISWYLTVTEAGKPPVTSTDQGLDILERDRAGHWQIVNYIAYQEEESS